MKRNNGRLSTGVTGIFLSLFLLVFVSSRAYGETNAVSNTVSTQSSTGRVILITMSQACRCTLLKCKSLTESVKTVMTNFRYSGFIVEEVDYSTDIEVANKYLQQYQMSFLPVLILTDREGKDYYKCSTDLAIDEYIKSLETILANEATDHSLEENR